MLAVTATDVNRTIDAVWRIESAKLIAGIARIVRPLFQRYQSYCRIDNNLLSQFVSRGQLKLGSVHVEA